MNLERQELEYLSAWAREEKAPDPYALPAHQLQARHQVQSVTLIRLIKAWARATGRKDEDIFDLYRNQEPAWPWKSAEEYQERLQALTAGAAGTKN